MKLYRCIKTVQSDDGNTFFIVGKIYEGYTFATPGGEWALEFIDETNTPHLVNGRYFRDHFKEIFEREQ